MTSRVSSGAGGLTLGLLLGLGCAIGTGESGFGPGVTIGGGGTGEGTGSGTAGDPSGDGADAGQDGATSVGDPTDTDAPLPGAEFCNGIDDDGDGEIDEDLPELTCGVGSCEVTQPSCANGMPQECTPGLPGGEVCNGLDDDCNGVADDGVEQACSTACGNGTIGCANGVEVPCDAPPPQAESCNLEDDDCNGSFDEGVGGCRVGVHRSLDPGTGEHFYTTNLAEAQCCGYVLESSDFYFLYAGPQPGLNAFYRCLKPGGKHLYTQSANCEGTTSEGVMGYIATAADVAGSEPLYRLYRPNNNDHFYTTSAAERNNALTNLGYNDEGIAGYVW